MLAMLVGLGLLLVGADRLVAGASRLAVRLGISPLVVGLTVVAFGTSSPELAISVDSVLTGEPDLALGNVVGSNIANVLLILGLSSVFVPLVVRSQLVRLDVPVMIVASAIVLVLVWDGLLGRLESAVLVLAMVAYLIVLLRLSRAEPEEVVAEYESELDPSRPGRPLRDGTFAVAGLVLLVIGSGLLVDGAVTLAENLGVSELVIGLTLVAVGTSLPEIATSVVAAVKGERDIAVGNVVGSNIFNLLVVLGISGLVAPAGIPVSLGALGFDIPVMLTVAIACLPIFFTGYRIARWEGGLFLGYYAAYLVFLVLDASEHDALELFSTAMLWFVLPLTLLTVVVSIWQSTRYREAT